MKASARIFVLTVITLRCCALKVLTRGPKADENNSTAVGSQKRARLDVGFGSFEANLSQQIIAEIHNATRKSPWTIQQQDLLVQNVTVALSQTLKAQLAPVKQSIGKTWMALPQDDQKDEYIQQLRSGFASVFEYNVNNIPKHLQLGLRRVEMAAGSSTTITKDILEKSEAILSENLFSEHCYENSRPGNGSGGPAHRFCLPSLLSKFVSRLNDTQGLISMSMRFEARAMSLAQRGGHEAQK
eukprot:TRINITY_DN45784_c0_g1_i1.p1 TRINITY_DN45784_c0_g1~~TRINITY_DN45784_c0_g1_i1.p1  ORF type:complete len:242 (-),score=48.38 TRINITY_DN45784_c0_g1_i1:190-915(-)